MKYFLIVIKSIYNDALHFTEIGWLEKEGN